MPHNIFTDSVIGFGGSHLSLHGMIEQDPLDRLLGALAASGVTFLDTADCYGWRSDDAHAIERKLENRLCQLHLNDVIHVGTKGGFTHHEGSWVLNGNPDYLFDAIRRSFIALGGIRPLTLWQLHAIDPTYPVSISLQAAVKAKAEGLVQHVGVCNVNNEQLRQALDVIDLVSVQNQSSAWFIEPDEQNVLETCNRYSLAFFAHTPLGGRFAWKVIHHSPLLQRIAAERHTSVYSIMIAWLRSKANCIVPLTGTTNPEHLRMNAEGARTYLRPAELVSLGKYFEGIRRTLGRRPE